MSLVYGFLGWLRLAAGPIRAVLASAGTDEEHATAVYNAMLAAGGEATVAELATAVAAWEDELGEDKLFQQRRQAREALEAQWRIDPWVERLRATVSNSRHEVGELTRRFGALHPVRPTQPKLTKRVTLCDLCLKMNSP